MTNRHFQPRCRSHCFSGSGAYTVAVQITLRRLLFTVAFVAAALLLRVPASQAGNYGDEKWCAVTNEGGDVMNWDCEYDSVVDCEPAVVQASRGFCAINPYYRPPQPAPAPQR
jgi:hypothetical protein